VLLNLNGDLDRVVLVGTRGGLINAYGRKRNFGQSSASDLPIQTSNILEIYRRQPRNLTYRRPQIGRLVLATSIAIEQTCGHHNIQLPLLATSPKRRLQLIKGPGHGVRSKHILIYVLSLGNHLYRHV
jgi:hypothetical protein